MALPVVPLLPRRLRTLPYTTKIFSALVNLPSPARPELQPSRIRNTTIITPTFPPPPSLPPSLPTHPPSSPLAYALPRLFLHVRRLSHPPLLLRLPLTSLRPQLRLHPPQPIANVQTRPSPFPSLELHPALGRYVPSTLLRSKTSLPHGGRSLNSPLRCRCQKVGA
jgi:hypothetical protein